MRNLRRSAFSLLLTVAAYSGLLAALAAVASAQSTSDPSSAQYDPQNIGVAGASAGETSGLNSNIGSLPFTGMDLIILAGVALVLTGTGLALRRLTMPRGL